MKKEVSDIFDDLDDYKRFCVHFGHPYNESDLYNEESETYRTYCDMKEGKRIANNWMRDAKINGRNIFLNAK